VSAQSVFMLVRELTVEISLEKASTIGVAGMTLYY
jgi:hypothetical protein